MRRLPALMLITALFMPMSSATAYAADAPKVFMFVREGSRDLDLMLAEEINVMRNLLEDAGYVVDIATPADEPMVAQTITLVPTIKLADVDVVNYAGVILPCMAPARGSPIPARIDEIAAQAVALGLPFAASRGSVATLAMAGGIENRKYAFAAAVDPAKRPEFDGGTFLGTGVVRDGKISTSGICPLAARASGQPDGTVGLTQSFIQSLRDAG